MHDQNMPVEGKGRGMVGGGLLASQATSNFFFAKASPGSLPPAARDTQHTHLHLHLLGEGEQATGEPRSGLQPHKNTNTIKQAHIHWILRTILCRCV
jgi:hypothetical protein